MLKRDFSIFPVLSTERLTLRSIADEDLELIHELRSDPVVNVLVGRDQNPTLESTKNFISKIEQLVQNNESMYWIITLKGETDLIGSVCLWNFDLQNDIVEVGYEMRAAFQGKGIMTEALNAVVEYAFRNLQAKMVTALPSADNIKSVALLKKMNFQLVPETCNNTHTDVENVVTYVMKNDQS